MKMNEELKEIIEKAKRKVEVSYGGIKRQWLKTKIDSYENPLNRIELYVYEGSPTKGYIVVNYERGLVHTFNAWGEKIYTYKK